MFYSPILVRPKRLINPSKQIKLILPHLSNSHKKRIVIYILVLSSLSILDLISVILLSSVASIGYRIINKDASNSRIENIFHDFLNLHLSQEQFIILLSVISLCLLIIKNFASALINLKFVALLTDVEIHLTDNIYKKLSNLNIRTFYSLTASEQQISLTTLPSRITSSLILPTITLLSEIFSVVILIIFALYASFLATLTMILCITLILFLSNRYLSERSERYGNHLLQSTLDLNNLNLQFYKGYRETIIFNLQPKFEKSFLKTRKDNALFAQKIQWLNTLFRYVFEVSIIMTAGIMAFIQLIVSDFRHAVTIFVMFIIIGFRLIPAGQRLQNTNLSFKASKPYLEKYLLLLNRFQSSELSSGQLKNYPSKASSKIGIELKNITFENQEGILIINNLSLKIPPGSLVLLVGKSGSGKSTLLDILGDLLPPTSGKIEYFSSTALLKSFGNVAFVSQDPFIFAGSLEENVTLSNQLVNESLFKDLTSKLNLIELKDRFKQDGKSGEIVQWGLNLSGGERQRIAIARALHSERGLVLMDEPISSLDEKNRKAVVSLIRQLKKQRTFIISTHTNDFIESADLIINLDTNKILSNDEMSN